MNRGTEQSSLTDCDREPVHLIGAIQGFGTLIAVNGDWIVAHLADNAQEILCAECTLELGEAVSVSFCPDAIAELRSATSSLLDPDAIERVFGIDLHGDGRLFDCALHISDSLFILEIEPHEVGAVERGMKVVRPLLKRLEQHRDLREMGDNACKLLRELLGYDRVMLYRFRQDDSGEVIAEAKRGDLETFLDLRYPRADIPQQARALFVRNRFRLIADMRSDPVAIRPAVAFEGKPLDLSMSVLRSHSQMHVEYMRNMGVNASLAISIVIRGKLWGMFACHHMEPRLLSYGLRTVAELFSEIVSLVVDRIQSAKINRQQEASRLLHDRLMRSFADGDALIESLPALAPIVSRAIEFDGISVLIDGVYNAKGHAPDEDQFRRMVPRLNTAPTGKLIVTECLADVVAEAEAFQAKAAGAIIMPISKRPRDFLALWRREELQTVTWAGDPNKTVDGDGRINPRKSFSAWQETMRGRSREWNDQDVQLAEGLRTSLLEIILRLTEEQVQERARSQQQQELLIAELNHRVRNILNLIKGLISQSRGEATSIEDFSEIVGGRISSLASAHDNITKGNWSPAPFRLLIESEVNAYVSGKQDRVKVTGPGVMIAPEAYTVLALVIHEMVTNSAKYGSLSDSSGALDIRISEGPSGDLEIAWAESGGPPVKPPQRRGFGSTIIERSVPHELGGQATIDYNLSGVTARFSIPREFVTWIKGGAPDGTSEMVLPTKPATSNGEIPQSVLLVEDSMIIALDTEDCLKELGVDTIRVESTVAGALKALEGLTPELAILDYNLGNESSEKVAEELSRREIPYWLATGYGEMGDRIEEMGAQGLLTKPYGKEELKSILNA
ncbi:MAG: GAF domain-containing protein [Erythrobacter sp.]|nr:GAF domain-containing protein [Erythrobacter sp.]